MKYCSFETHTCNSTLDGLNDPIKYFERAARLNIDAIAVSDHATLSGAVATYEAAEKTNIRGLTGTEINIANGDINSEKQRGYSHLLVYPKNDIGWRNLLKLNYLSTTESRYYYKPRIYKEDLFEYSEGLLISSNCIGSILPRKIFTNINDAAQASTYEQAKNFISSEWEKDCKHLIEEYQSIFKDDFYIGCNCHNLVAQQLQRDIVRELATKYHIKFMPDVDAHYAEPSDAKWHESLICISTGKVLEQREKMRQEGSDLLFGDNSQYYLYSPEEMSHYFTESELLNTYEIFDKCQFKLKKRPLQIPSIHENPNKLMRDICLSKLREIGRYDDKQYYNQLMEELLVYEEFNLASYMLLVKDILEEAVKLNINCSIRGSASGSIVAWLLNISFLDPIKYKLYFVRFLNKGRMSQNKVSLPDIDIDIATDKRDILINRIKNKYGDDKVANIATFGYLGAKGAIKDAFRITASYYDKDKSKQIAEKVSTYIPNKLPDEPDVTIENLLESSDSFKKFSQEYPLQFEYATHLQGILRNSSTHAAGLIISNESLVNFMPLHYNKKIGGNISNCGMDDVADWYGGVKIDMLGLKSNSCQQTASNIYEEMYNK